MMDIHAELKSIRDHPAHRQIVYSSLQKDLKPTLKELKRGIFVSLSVDLSKQFPKVEKTIPDQSIFIPPITSKSPKYFKVSPRFYLRTKKLKSEYSDFYKKIFQRDDYKNVLISIDQKSN